MVNELYHHGIKGQKWGVRRFQNEDGSLTKSGLKRYADLSQNQNKLSSKLASIDSKKERITTKYNTVGHAKQEARVARLKEKRNKLERKVSKLEQRALKGKNIGYFGHRTLNKAYKLDKKIANQSKAKLKFDKQISSLDAQSAKIQKRIERYNKKLNQLDPKHEAAGKIYVDKLKIDEKANGAEITKRNLRATAKDISADKSSTRSQLDWADYVTKNI